MQAWTALRERWIALREEERTIRKARAGVDALSRCCAARRAVRAAAAANLPARGQGRDDVVNAVIRALLEVDIAENEHAFVLEVLAHRKQFPRCYARPLVRAALRERKHVPRLIGLTSIAYGSAVVMSELLRVAREGELDHETMRYCLAFAWPRRWLPPLPYFVPRPLHDDGLYDELIRVSSGGTWRRVR